MCCIRSLPTYMRLRKYRRHSKYVLFQFCIKLTIQKLHFSILHQLAKKNWQGYASHNCHHKLSASRYNWWHSQLPEARVKEVTVASNSVSLWVELNLRMLNGSWIPSWVKSLLLCRKILMTTYTVAILEHILCCGLVTTGEHQKVFLFLKMCGMIKAEITEPHQRSDLPQGGLKVPCMLIDSWASWLALVPPNWWEAASGTFTGWKKMVILAAQLNFILFSQLSFDFHTLMLQHICKPFVRNLLFVLYLFQL